VVTPFIQMPSAVALSVALLAAPLPMRAADGPVASSAARQSVRLFRPQDLGLLEAPDRDQWQRPDQIMDALGIADGAVVADLGAGGGWFTVRLARRVGPNGLIYAEDIQPEMISAIQRRLQAERLSNVRPILGTPRDPRLPPGVDVILIADAYHEMEDPVALLRNAARALRPQGRIGVVDFTPGGGGPGPDPQERVSPDAVIKAAAEAGLSLAKREALPPFQFLLVFTPRTGAARGPG
jgi:ubiquinone/menaquinone biosynthesis C-methylase UbiE